MVKGIIILICCLFALELTYSKSIDKKSFTGAQKQKIFKNVKSKNLTNGYSFLRAELDCFDSGFKIISGVEYQLCSLYDYKHEQYLRIKISTISVGLSALAYLGYTYGWIYCDDQDSSYYQDFEYNVESGIALGLGYIYNYGESQFCSLTLHSLVAGGGFSLSSRPSFRLKPYKTNWITR